MAELVRRMTKWRLGPWWFALVLPPLWLLTVLNPLHMAVSPNFMPGFTIFGLAAGIVAGGCEEIGRTGFAYPRMSHRLGALPAALLLGLIWGVWHLPVVDSLGAAGPHGHWWLEFFLAFVALLIAIRVVICWLYTQTGSLLLAQLFHASFTASLATLSPPRVTAAQDARSGISSMHQSFGPSLVWSSSATDQA